MTQRGERYSSPVSCKLSVGYGCKGDGEHAPEIAWRDSSGGFSEYFERPWYQDEIVGTFLKEEVSEAANETLGSTLTPKGGCSRM
jgi:tripeptidyl-peptidase-1